MAFQAIRLLAMEMGHHVQLYKLFTAQGLKGQMRPESRLYYVHQFMGPALPAPVWRKGSLYLMSIHTEVIQGLTETLKGGGWF